MSQPIPLWEPISEAAPAISEPPTTAGAPRVRWRGRCVVSRSSDMPTWWRQPATRRRSRRRRPPTGGAQYAGPPEHTAFLAAIDAFFTPERMQTLEPRIRTIARDIIIALPRNTIVDTVTDIGYPFAVRAQADWLGWQGIENELLAWMAENHAATRSADPDADGRAGRGPSSLLRSGPGAR